MSGTAQKYKHQPVALLSGPPDPVFHQYGQHMGESNVDNPVRSIPQIKFHGSYIVLKPIFIHKGCHHYHFQSVMTTLLCTDRPLDRVGTDEVMKWLLFTP